MGSYATRIIGIGFAVASAAVWAQTPPTATQEQLVSNGFLGDQNSRLTGSQDARPDASFTERASAAIARKEYARALGIVRPYRLTDPLSYHLLAGQAYQGLANYDAARKEFAEALKRRKNMTAVQVALGMIEAEHGDKASAASILQELTARRDACAGRCAENAELMSGVFQIEAALKARSN